MKNDGVNYSFSVISDNYLSWQLFYNIEDTRGKNIEDTERHGRCRHYEPMILFMGYSYCTLIFFIKILYLTASW